jgi:DNA-binding Xre family transcriptional regulator
MITVKIKQAAKRRGIKTSYQLARAMGDKNNMSAARLWKGEQLPTLDTLDRACEALGDCDLSELITRKPNKRRKTASAKNGSEEK